MRDKVRGSITLLLDALMLPRRFRPPVAGAPYVAGRLALGRFMSHRGVELAWASSGRARCVPERAGNRGHSRSIAVTPVPTDLGTDWSRPRQKRSSNSGSCCPVTCHIRATYHGDQGSVTVTHGNSQHGDQDQCLRRSIMVPGSRSSKLVMPVRSRSPDLP